MSLTPKEEMMNFLIVILKTQNDLLDTGLTVREANEIILDTMLLHCPISQETQDLLTPSPTTKETP